ncbi:MAG TPA: hypothetical protein PLW34_12390 [Termitinemataceae bacterium]|nr:hypothetical protein [Termitinemataceae bacterium]HOM23638.1 hypothetical protein [Termitinemataceae bacterium]HPQ01494.1 hypothetical protein [Termitinemataceae bacterium]
MKKTVFLWVGVFLYYFVTGGGPLSAQVYRDFRPLYQIKTRYFTIVFPKESSVSAQYLASFADRVYEDVAAKLETQPELPIPVLITPDPQAFNGYFNYYPGLLIVLYETTLSPNGSLLFDDILYRLFYHELTHFVSLVGTSPSAKLLYRLFGSLGVALPLFLVPFPFTEGVTVSFESQESLGRPALGRARDPLIAGYLRQDILENRWKSFSQTLGCYDQYPGASLGYWYGGYFSRYLQDTYGMERYAHLWRYLSNPFSLSPLEDVYFPFSNLRIATGAFRNLYGLPLEEAWNNFREAMAIREPVLMNPTRLSDLGNYGALTTDGKALYYYDSSRRTVYRRSIQQKMDGREHLLASHTVKEQGAQQTLGRPQPLFTTSLPVEGLSVHPETGEILVSTYRGDRSFPQLAVGIWKDGRWNWLATPRLSEATWWGTHILAIQSVGYQRNLVLVTRDGQVQILFQGSLSSIIWNPVASADGKRLYFWMRQGDQQRLVRLELEHQGFAPETVKIRQLQEAQLPDSITWPRYLSLGKEGLLAAWNDNSLYRLVRFSEDRVEYQTIPLSGGIHQPQDVGGTLFYLGYFSEGERICRLDYKDEELGVKRAPLSWIEAGNLISQTSPLGSQPAQSYTSPEGIDETAFPIRPYRDWGAVFPRSWFPLVTYDFTQNSWGFGGALLFGDLTERWITLVYGTYNPQGPGGLDLSVNSQFILYPLLFNLTVSDDFFPASDVGPAQRQSLVSLSVQLGEETYLAGSFSVGGGSRIEANESPYKNWDWLRVGATASLGYQFWYSVFRDPSKRPGWNVELLSRALYLPPSEGSDFFKGPLYGGFEVFSQGNLEWPSVEFTLEGAWSPMEGLGYGPRGMGYRVGGQNTTEQARYRSLVALDSPYTTSWYLQGTAAARLFTLEIQKDWGTLYSQRLYGNWGLHGAYAATPLWTISFPIVADGEAQPSRAFGALFVQVGIVVSPTVTQLARTHFAFEFEGGYTLAGDPYTYLGLKTAF